MAKQPKTTDKDVNLAINAVLMSTIAGTMARLEITLKEIGETLKLIANRV